jgi:hypothetical protein
VKAEDWELRSGGQIFVAMRSLTKDEKATVEGVVRSCLTIDGGWMKNFCLAPVDGEQI